jgi:hypothetical protein
MLTEEVAEYRRLLEDFHGQIANYDATGARVTEIWVRELNDPAFPRHLLAEHTVKVSRTASSLAILAVDRSAEKPPSEARHQLDSTQVALASVISRIQDELRKTEYVLADRGLEGIVGEFLSSVEFVMDYVQLRFCGATLTAFTCPDIQTPNRFFLPSSYGYRDALCSLIGATVENTEVEEGAFLRISFAEDRSITLQLDPSEVNKRQSANFWSTSDCLWSW